MKRPATLVGAAFVLFAFPSVSMALSVNIAGAESTGAYTTMIDTSVLFDPNSGPVTASGTIDLSGLGTSGVLFAGLISKVDYDHHLSISSPYFPDYLFFLDTAYASFRTPAVGPKAGLGQYLFSSEDTQAYAVTPTNPVPNPITGFDASFGAIGMTLNVQGNTTSLNYNFGIDTSTFTQDGSPYTDFSQGAYAFVGTYDGVSTFDVTFDGPGARFCLPAALPLVISGLGGMGLLGWRRKRKAARPFDGLI